MYTICRSPASFYECLITVMIALLCIYYHCSKKFLYYPMRRYLQPISFFLVAGSVILLLISGEFFGWKIANYPMRLYLLGFSPPYVIVTTDHDLGLFVFSGENIGYYTDPAQVASCWLYLSCLIPLQYCLIYFETLQYLYNLKPHLFGLRCLLKLNL